MSYESSHQICHMNSAFRYITVQCSYNVLYHNGYPTAISYTERALTYIIGNEPLKGIKNKNKNNFILHRI